MAHFAKLNSENIVISVEVINNNESVTEQNGIDFLKTLHGEDTIWKQTSFNTHGGIHLLGGTPFRKNFGSVGFTYDEDKDAFIPPKPFNSWTLNETSCTWEAPSEQPGDEYRWNEDNTSWEKVEEE